MQLKQCLMEVNTSLLNAIASYRRFDVGDAVDRGQLIISLGKRLGDRQSFQATVNKLTSWEHEIIYQLCEAGGQINRRQMQATWGNDDHELDKRWFWHEHVSRGLSRLRLAGILFLTRVPGASEPVYTFPVEYQSQFLSPPFIISHGEYAPYSYYDFDTTILSDIYQMSLYFEQFRVRSLRNGSLPKRNKSILLDRLEDITPAIAPRTPGYLELIFQILLKLGFVTQIKGQIRSTEPMKDWLKLSPYNQIRSLFDSWMEMDDQVDLESICQTKIVSAGLRHPVSHVKRSVIELLKDLPEQWISMDDLSKYFQHNRPFFFRPDHSPGIWRLIDDSNNESIQARGIWNRLEHRILQYMIEQCLAAFGLVSVGLDSAGNIEGFHITQTGKALLHRNPAILGGIPGKPLNEIIIQPDFAVMAPSSLVLSVRDRLQTVAEFVQGGHMQTYRLTRNSIAHALESGMVSGEILHFLESVARDGLPPNVRMSVSDWIEEFGKIEFSHQVVMRTDDEFLMQEILSRPVTNKLIQEQLGSTAAVVDQDNVETIIAEMKRIGYLPRFAGQTNGTGNMVPISLTLAVEDVEFLRSLLMEKMKDECEVIDNNEEIRMLKIVESLAKSLGDDT